MKLLLNFGMAASGFTNKAYSEEDLTNIDKAQFPSETKITQQPLDIKEVQYEKELHKLNSSTDKFR